VDSLPRKLPVLFSLLPLRWRIVRAKAKIRDAGIPYQVPSLAELPERLDTVLQVIYLVFNEGYAASSGTSLTRTALGRSHPFGATGYGLLPAPEVIGLLALMLLQESRRTARTSSTGVILLEDQNRSLWNLEQISEGGGAGAASARHDNSVRTHFRLRSRQCIQHRSQGQRTGEDCRFVRCASR